MESGTKDHTFDIYENSMDEIFGEEVNLNLLKMEETEFQLDPHSNDMVSFCVIHTQSQLRTSVGGWRGERIRAPS